jgi:hypothetical protein
MFLSKMAAGHRLACILTLRANHIPFVSSLDKGEGIGQFPGNSTCKVSTADLEFQIYDEPSEKRSNVKLEGDIFGEIRYYKVLVARLGKKQSAFYVF